MDDQLRSTLYEVRYGTRSYSHRDKKFSTYLCGPTLLIDSYPMFLALMPDDKWWFISDKTDDEDETIDFGPFDTWEEGLLYGKLRGDTI